MYCNLCKYEDITQIKLYDNIVDSCSKCDYCTISINDYSNFIKMAIIKNGFLNINIFTIIDMLSIKEQHQYEMLINSFDISNLNDFKETTNKCRICCGKLFEIKKDNNFSLFLCENCLNVYFQKNEFKKYMEKRIKLILKFYYFIYIKERFLHLIGKEGKNNVEE